MDQGEYVDEGENHEHTENWSPSEQVTFTIQGGHQFAHPVTDQD